MKKVTESQLKDKVNSLREYINVIESTQQDEGVMSTLGQWAGNAAGTVSNAASAVKNAVGSGVDTVKQGFSDLTTGAQQGYQATTGTQPAQGAKPAAGQAVKPTSKQGDPEVMKKQQFLKNLGHNVKVDGIWGPETEAAYKAAFPDAPSNQPAGGTTSAPAAATAPGQTYQQAQASKQGLSKDIAAAAGMPNPNATEPAQATPAQQGSVFGADGKITGMPASPAPKKPGVVEFNESNELNRIIQLLK